MQPLGGGVRRRPDLRWRCNRRIFKDRLKSLRLILSGMVLKRSYDQVLFEEDNHVDPVKLDWTGGIKADDLTGRLLGWFPGTR